MIPNVLSYVNELNLNLNVSTVFYTDFFKAALHW